jgi:toxin HigB-1
MKQKAMPNLKSTSSERIIDIETQVIIPKRVFKSLTNLPSYIRDKFHRWVRYVNKLRVSKAQMYPGFRDEKLRGQRSGQRSVRLNRQYRVIYQIKNKEDCKDVTVLEVNAHAYKK